jgi:hypothetical protein
MEKLTLGVAQSLEGILTHLPYSTLVEAPHEDGNCEDGEAGARRVNRSSTILAVIRKALLKRVMHQLL